MAAREVTLDHPAFRSILWKLPQDMPEELKALIGERLLLLASAHRYEVPTTEYLEFARRWDEREMFWYAPSDPPAVLPASRSSGARPLAWAAWDDPSQYFTLYGEDGEVLLELRDEDLISGVYFVGLFAGRACNYFGDNADELDYSRVDELYRRELEV